MTDLGAYPGWLDGYLARLGIDDPGRPSLAGLRRLHRAHVERVPYEALDIQLRLPTSVHPREAVARVLRGRGGYCVQLNTAFAALLTRLGYLVTQHRAGIQGRGTPPVNADFAPHLALSVHIEGLTWLVDVGLGDGLYDPLPLLEGGYRHGPLSFTLAPSRVERNGWRFDHDPRGSIGGMDVRMTPAVNGEFAEWHPYLATSKESRLVRAVAVAKRDASGADVLMGCMLRRITGNGREVQELTTEREWYGALEGVFGLRLDDVDETRKTRLWRKVKDAHEQWLGSKQKAA